MIVTSSATGAGLEELAGELLRRVTPRGATAAEGDEAVPDAHAALVPGGLADMGAEEDLAEHMVFRPNAGRGFEVQRIGERSFAVKGKGIERLLARYDVENEDAMAYLEERLRRIGVLGALEAEGFQPGDELQVGEITLELDPDAPV